MRNCGAETESNFSVMCICECCNNLKAVLSPFIFITCYGYIPIDISFICVLVEKMYIQKMSNL